MDWDITTFDKLVGAATDIFEDGEGSFHDIAVNIVNHLKREKPKILKKIFFEIVQKELAFEGQNMIKSEILSWSELFSEVVRSCLVKRLSSNPKLAAENKKR